MDLVDDGRCFACGSRNPSGLRLEFRLDDEGRAVAKFVPRQEFQGFSGVLHGGIVCTLLDEAMAWALMLRGKLAVTVSVKVTFRKPVRIGDEVTVMGEIVRGGSGSGSGLRSNSNSNSKRYALRAEIRGEKGDISAEAEGLFLVVSDVPPAAQSSTRTRHV